jgi:hypothetical protein
MRWNSCNILHFAPDAKRLWQFNAKGGGFALGSEQRVAHTEKLPAKGVAKNWSSLWSPKLNIAWLPAENVFLRVIELPASNFDETRAMVELQLEKLSPIPVTQAVWTLHIAGTHTAPPKGEAPPENLQTVIVVIAARNVVEEFLGKLEAQGFLADRLEVPMLDQLTNVGEKADGAWVFPTSVAGQSGALVAFWREGVLKNLSLVTLPATGDRVKELKEQFAHIAWAGELEGWLTETLKWHLVADQVNAAEWENVLHAALGEAVAVSAPPAPAELAARTAKRAATAGQSALLPEEFTARYKNQFFDRLWLRGLFYALIAYGVGLVIYFAAVAWAGVQTKKVESKVAGLGAGYTNTLQLKARYAVLTERAQLKYAALDCWQIVAEALPQGINLQRFNFNDGKKLSLNGTCSPEQLESISGQNGFYDSVRKAKLKGQPMFNQNPSGSDQFIFKQVGNVINWSFAVELLHTETATP